MIKYTAEFYRGNKIVTGRSHGFLSRVGYQVVATDPITGKRRYVFTCEYGNKTPCLKSQWVASHYKSGPNKADRETLEDFKIWAANLAAELNRTQPY